MTPPEDFEAELMRLAREHPLFPLFVTYGLEYLSQRLDLFSDIHIFAMFGGRMAPDSIKSDLGQIKELLNDAAPDDTPYS
ncbi:hypothetical protein [Alistipes timonensis]